MISLFSFHIPRKKINDKADKTNDVAITNILAIDFGNNKIKPLSKTGNRNKLKSSAFIILYFESPGGC